jgi:hypothetical protein
MVRTIATSLLLLSISLVALSETRLLGHIPLEWRPTSELQLSTTSMTTSMVTIGTFIDGRDHKESIGENSEEDPPRCTAS